MLPLSAKSGLAARISDKDSRRRKLGAAVLSLLSAILLMGDVVGESSSWMYEDKENRGQGGFQLASPFGSSCRRKGNRRLSRAREL